MKTAMLLAAGRGERLRPLTFQKPKALCEIKGKPLIEHHIINLAKANYTHIVINHAYLGAQIRQYLGCGKQWGVKIFYSPEPPGGLETGGGIFQALSLLGNQPFLIVNADIYTDYDFSRLTLPEDRLAKLVLISNPSHGDFGFDDTNQLVINEKRLYTFAGISCCHPQLFANHNIGRYSWVPTIRRLADDKQIAGEIYAGLWIDVGSMARLNQAQNIE